MAQIIRKVLLLTIALSIAVLVGCGGSSSSSSDNSDNGNGGDSGGGDPAPSASTSIIDQRDLADCVDTPSSTDVYAIDSYHACGDPDGELTGMWMVVADYQVVSALGNSFEGQWRMGMRIVEENGDLFVEACSGYAFPDQRIVASIEQDALTVVFPDPMTSAAVVELEVIDALHMEGEHQAQSGPIPVVTDPSVTRSTVKARKVADDAGLAFGSFAIDYEIRSQSGVAQGSSDDGMVRCFVQSLGESVAPGNVIPYSETTNVLADIGTAASPIIVTSAATMAKPRPEEDEVDQALSVVEAYLGGDALVGSSDPDQLEIQYLRNSRQGIELMTVVDDGEEPNSFANGHAILEF